MILKLQTNRLLLRQPAFGDEVELVSLLNNINITRMTGQIPFPYSDADAQAFIESCAQSEDRWKFVILDKSTKLLLGGVGITGEEIGYWVAESHWGKGFASEAASAVISNIFATGKQAQLIARSRADNPASGRVLEKLGFERSGVGVCDSKATGKSHSTVEAILTKKRWNEQ
jgi:RimJ/RimL family protein N-acetyltransferase